MICLFAGLSQISLHIYTLLHKAALCMLIFFFFFTKTIWSKYSHILRYWGLVVVVVWSLSPVWFRDPMHCSPPGSSVHGISQARTQEWVAISFSRRSSWPRNWTQVSCIAGGFLTNESKYWSYQFWEGHNSSINKIYHKEPPLCTVQLFTWLVSTYHFTTVLKCLKLCRLNLVMNTMQSQCFCLLVS